MIENSDREIDDPKAMIWLDDVRDPPSPEWTVARDGREFIRLWIHLFPDVSVVSFDHDLGGELSGSDCAMVVAHTLRVTSTEDFEWNVHSGNPVGSDRMRAQLSDWPKWEGQ